MAQYFAFLLLCAMVATNVDARSDPRGRDPCYHGESMTHLFSYKPCGRNLRREFRDLRITTVEGLRQYANNYCRETMPAVRQCFAEKITRCDPSQQDYLNSLARGTQFLCNANDEVNSWVEFVLSRLTADDLSVVSCRSNRDVSRKCFDVALAAAGLNMDTLFTVFESASVRDMVSMAQAFFPTSVECLAEGYREDPNRCPNWRQKILDNVKLLVFFPMLGVNVTYTEAQLEEMFAFSNEEQGIFLRPGR